MRGLARAACVLAIGCGGVPADLGLDEPLRVPGARFVEAPLPGVPPDEPGPPAPAITLVETPNTVVRLGQAHKELSGRASTDAAAVAIAFTGLGSGHWVSPLGPPDPTAGDELTWTLDAAIGWDVPIGPGSIDVVAIDAAGDAGVQYRTRVCVRPDLLDNFASCDPSLAPPHTVIALSWDADVDLDLVVRTPDGKLVSASAPSTIAHPPPITPQELAADGVGVLDRDSNAGCAIDSINREALVWRTAPRPGTYLVYANLADACGQARVDFTATLYRAGEGRLVEVARQGGRLLGAAADGGRGPGLFLLQLAL
ncbi:MAG: hypothetical protein KIT31_17495 [Deltaproteobacteria bacterium]|nr:hypothetical protein [Deltaproteobacteria bacterium]